MATKTASKIKVRPLGAKVLVRRDEAESITEAGIYLPESAKDKPKTGVVTAVGTGAINTETGDRIPMTLKKGDHVIWHITNVETAHDATHGFQLGGYNISLSIEPGETTTFEIDADRDGVYAYYCTEFCSALHLEMMGYMLVEP